MELNNKTSINSENLSKNLPIYIIWVVLILSPIYMLYFFYSLATGISIIYDTIYQLIFIITGMITLFEALAVQQIMNARN
jgi:hypothetical protein